MPFTFSTDAEIVPAAPCTSYELQVKIMFLENNIVNSALVFESQLPGKKAFKVEEWQLQGS